MGRRAILESRVVLLEDDAQLRVVQDRSVATTED